MSSACRSQVRQLELDRARRIYGRAIAECQKAWVTMVTTCYNMLEHVTTTNQTFWRSAHLFGSDSSDSTFSWLKICSFMLMFIGSAKGFLDGCLLVSLHSFAASQANTCLNSLSGVGCIADLIGENFPGLRRLGDALGQHRQMPWLVCSIRQSVGPSVPWIGKRANSGCNL